MKRNLLITQTSKYARIFQIRNDGKLFAIYFQKFSGDRDLSFTKHDLTLDLPDTITYNILFRLFYTYLRTKHFDEACILLGICRGFAFAVYRQIYGKYEPVPLLEMISRLSITIHLLETLHDEYLSEINHDLEPNWGLRLECRSPRSKPIAPWDFYPSLLIENHGKITVPNEPLRTYITGRNLGDIVQVIGKSIQGIVEASQVHHPVFTFMLSTLSQNLIPNETDFWRNRNFKRFSKLLRIVFGTHAGVYFMVNPPGYEGSPFTTQSDSYIRFQ